jgi:predicted PurR-regulated permease PerM
VSEHPPQQSTPTDSQENAPGLAPSFRLRAWSLTTLALLAVLYTLYYAQEFLLPVVLALLLALLLSPLVQALHRLRVPHAVGAVLVVFGFLAALATAGVLLSAPAWDWLAKAPQVMSELEYKIRPLRQTVKEVSAAAAQVERITEGEQAPDEPPVVRVREQSLREAALAQAQAMAVSTVMTVFLLYFLLASGELFLRNVLSALPKWGDKRRALEIARHLQREISTYLFTFTLINLVLAVITSLIAYLVGLPNPVLWGVVAGVLNFVPYLGPVVTITVLTVVSVLTFDTAREIALAPGLFFIVTSLEGQLITPTILGQRLALNPIMIFLGLIFWGWLWGVVGALLAVPIMVTIKIVCDHVEPLQPVGVAMGR